MSTKRLSAMVVAGALTTASAHADGSTAIITIYEPTMNFTSVSAVSNLTACTGDGAYIETKLLQDFAATGNLNENAQIAATIHDIAIRVDAEFKAAVQGSTLDTLGERIMTLEQHFNDAERRLRGLEGLNSSVIFSNVDYPIVDGAAVLYATLNDHRCALT